MKSTEELEQADMQCMTVMRRSDSATEIFSNLKATEIELKGEKNAITHRFLISDNKTPDYLTVHLHMCGAPALQL